VYLKRTSHADDSFLARQISDVNKGIVEAGVDAALLVSDHLGRPKLQQNQRLAFAEMRLYPSMQAFRRAPSTALIRTGRHRRRSCRHRRWCRAKPPGCQSGPWAPSVMCHNDRTLRTRGLQYVRCRNTRDR